MSLSTFSNNVKSGKLSKKETLVIQKPRKKGSCTSENEEYFSVDHRVTNTAKKSKNFKESRSDSESLSYWLKPGVSLPRVHSKEKTVGRLEAGEPFLNGNNPEFASIVQNFKKHEKSIEKILTLEPSNTFDIKKEKVVLGGGQKVLGLSSCNFEFKISSTNLNFDNFEITDDKIEESHALKQWEIWLKRRKHLQEYLQKKLKRPASHLILNRSETFRQVIESKAVKAYCNFLIPKKKGANEGKKTEQILCQTICFGESLPSKKKPQIEFIGLPEIIKKEKNLIKDFRESQGVNGCRDKIMVYHKKTPCHLKKKGKTKITHLQCVDIEHLAVVGRKYPLEVLTEFPGAKSSQPATFSQDLDESVILETFKSAIVNKGSERKLPHVVKEESSIFCLVINDKEIKYEIDSDFHPDTTSESLTWKIDFGSNPVGTLSEKTLRVKNKGTIATSYDWICQEVECENVFDSLKSAFVEPCFFFNKNSGIFIPDQTYNLKFYSHARRAGTRNEIWYIKTNPPISNNDNKLKIILSSFATSDSEPQISSVEKYLKKRVGISISKKILNNLLNVIVEPRYGLQELEYRSMLSEKMMFEFQNPKHYYHNYELKDLKQLYLRIICLPEREWDCSFSTLLNVLKNCVLEQSQRETLMIKISLASKKLLRPSYVTQSKNRKYRMAYNILSSIFNSIDSDWEFFKNCLLFKFNENMCLSQFEEESLSEETVWEGESITSQNLFDARHINSFFFESMFYLKVYYKLCEAAERIAKMLKSMNFAESCRENLYSHRLI